MLTAQSDVGRIRKLVLKSPAAAMIDQSRVDREWQALNYLERPDYATAVTEYEGLLGLLPGDIDITFLPENGATGMDSIYVRDAAIATDAGLVLCNMGKAARSGEPGAMAQRDIKVIGAVSGDGRIEGGDVTWLTPRLLAAGLGYRTNAEGIRQLSALLADDVEVITVPLPHWQGPDDVFHLMSMLSPITEDILLVFSPLMPVPFRTFLTERGFHLVEVPNDEFDSMGCNVLALGDDRCLLLEGNPVTRARLEAAGIETIIYEGNEISRKGCGGPTCLTRPLLQEIEDR